MKFQARSFIRSQFLKTFRGLTIDATHKINCAMPVNTCFRDLTQRLAFQVLQRIYFLSDGAAGNVSVKKLIRMSGPSSGVVLELRRIA